MNKIKTDIKIGQRIFENVPEIVRPNWAGLVLSRFDRYLEKIPVEILELYDIIEKKEKWKLAHDQFTKIRMLNLSNADKDFELYLRLAERVAKVTYNSSEQSAPFDANSGFAIPMFALQYCDLIDDEHLHQEVKSTILIFQRNKGFKNSITATTDLIIYKKIDDILWIDRDPIGVNDIAPRDEYQGYVPEIFRLKKNGADRIEIAKKLLDIERNQIGILGTLDECLIIADKIIEA
ncbi:hypothetical protein [Gelidibacter mesophilus]|uniref:hypothetical protein n=1 Tax=Gelidibacter mesophilus TaxID=169050 RepID=UPI0003F75ACA|nr:hypothetical protein [Gelidibacter mesophilus]